MKTKRLPSFEDLDGDKWQDHYKGMPEYNAVEQKPPEVTAVFKFETTKDFEKFNALLKKHIYKGEKPFDGMQRKDKKSTWFPLKPKANKYRFKNES